MTVYVDRARIPFRGMLMSHMLADSDDELHAMAAAVGLRFSNHQKAGTPHSHYDLCQAKRALAVRLGAVEISRRDLARLIARKRLLTSSL